MNVANEKGCISYTSDIGDHGAGENSTTVLPVHAYVHDTPPAPQPKAFANPGPLGLFSYSSTLFIIALYDVQARGVIIPNAAVGMASFIGGLAQFAAGMWDFANGNMFGATAFTSYGGFFMAYAAFLHPGFGVADAYAGHPHQLSNALGIVLAPWFAITFVFLLATLRVNLALVLAFFCADMTFLLLMISDFTQSLAIQRIGGLFGIATSALTFYLGAAQFLTEDNFWFPLPLGQFHRRHHVD